MITVNANIEISESKCSCQSGGMKAKIINFESDSRFDDFINLELDKTNQITGLSIVKEKSIELNYQIDVFLEVVDDGPNKIIRLKKSEVSLFGKYDVSTPLFSKVGFTGSLKIATPSPDIENNHPVNYSGIGELDIVSLPASEFERSSRVVFKNLIPFNVDDPQQTFTEGFSHAQNFAWYENKINAKAMITASSRVPTIMSVDGGIHEGIQYKDESNSYQIPVVFEPKTKATIVVYYIEKSNT